MTSSANSAAQSSTMPLPCQYQAGLVLDSDVKILGILPARTVDMKQQQTRVRTHPPWLARRLHPILVLPASGETWAPRGCRTSYGTLSG